MKVAITGAGSVLARSIMPLLDADQRIKTILALDNRPYAGFPSPKIKYRKADVRDARELELALAGGFTTWSTPPLMIAQVFLEGVSEDGMRRLEACEPLVREGLSRELASLERRGGGLEVHLYELRGGLWHGPRESGRGH